MADNGFKNGRQFPYPEIEEGKGYQQLLVSRSQAILNSLINLLPSNYESEIVGPNYTVYMKAMATELARISIILEQVGTDMSFEQVRSEYLWDTVGYLVFVNQQLPDLDFDDESFRKFLLAVIDIYFQGSTPEAIHKGIELFTDEEFVIREVYKEAEKPNSAYDISDQFSFFADFELQAQFPKDVFKIDKNLRLLLEIIRPAHTLYRLRFIFDEDADLVNSVDDQVSMHLRDYHYADARFYCEGMAGFESTTGYVDSNLSILSDDDPTKPLYSVQEGATLVIPTGPSSGRYTVVGHPSSTSVRLFPRMKHKGTNISYQVEIDRLGRKQEIQVVDEDASAQFNSPERLTVDAGGPYTMVQGTTSTLSASSNGKDVTYVWDFDGDNVYDDATGASVSYTAPASPGEVVVWVKATDGRGRQAKAKATVTITS
jgi:hypothetical protein